MNSDNNPLFLRFTQELNKQQNQSENLQSSQLVSKDKKRKNNNQNIDEILNCFICMGKLVSAQMCPSCSKMCCELCIKRWLTEQKSECPYCRAPLRISKLVNCRFVSDIRSVIDNYKSNQSPKQENCQEHEDNQIQYFCKDCQSPICSDCAIYDEKHKSHKFEKISKIYQEHQNRVNNELQQLDQKYQDLQEQKQHLETIIVEAQKQKEDQSSELQNYFEQMNSRIDQELKTKLFTLLQQKGDLNEQIEYLENIKDQITNQLNVSSQSTLILKSDDMCSEIVPEYDSGVFIMEDYSKIRNEHEVVYSEPLYVNSIQWRLKVYPNGNGVAKNNYLSIFLEMTQGNHYSQKYEYKVEMMNQINPSIQVCREFASDFETGECWGYNRFFKLDLLEREGYITSESDRLILKYSVRNPSYYFQSKDLKNYIVQLSNKNSALENQIKEQQEIIKQLQSIKHQNNTNRVELNSVSQENIVEQKNQHKEDKLQIKSQQKLSDGLSKPKAQKLYNNQIQQIKNNLSSAELSLKIEQKSKVEQKLYQIENNNEIDMQCLFNKKENKSSDEKFSSEEMYYEDQKVDDQDQIYDSLSQEQEICKILNESDQKSEKTQSVKSENQFKDIQPIQIDDFFLKNNDTFQQDILQKQIFDNFEKEDEDSFDEIQKVRKNLMKQFNTQLNAKPDNYTDVSISLENFLNKTTIAHDQLSNPEIKSSSTVFKESQKQRFQLEKNIFAMNALNFSENLMKKLNHLKGNKSDSKSKKNKSTDDIN